MRNPHFRGKETLAQRALLTAIKMSKYLAHRMSNVSWETRSAETIADFGTCEKLRSELASTCQLCDFRQVTYFL